jgi:hypothetical protein
MTKSTKILLSTPSIISLFLFVIIVFPSLSFKVFPSMLNYNIGVLAVLGLSIIQVIYFNIYGK